MKKAIRAVQSKKMGLIKSSKKYGVSYDTLSLHCKDKSKLCNRGIIIKTGRRPVFPIEVEQKLVSYILDLKSKRFDLTTKEIKKIAFQLAEDAGIPHNFNNIKKEAGDSWLKHFKKRNANVFCRKPKAKSVDQAQAFNEPEINTVDEDNIPTRILFNMNKSAPTTVQKPIKLLASKRENKWVLLPVQKAEIG